MGVAFDMCTGKDETKRSGSGDVWVRSVSDEEMCRKVAASITCWVLVCPRTVNDLHGAGRAQASHSTGISQQAPVTANGTIGER